MFSKYLFVYKTRIIRSFTYKFEVYGNILMQTIIMITTSFFWRALFQDKAFGNGITADSMMTYTIMSSVLSVLFITGVERRIQESVEKGTIAIDLMRPVNIFGMFLAEDLGSITALLIQNLLPILLLGSLLIKFPPSCHCRQFRCLRQASFCRWQSTGCWRQSSACGHSRQSRWIPFIRRKNI